MPSFSAAVRALLGSREAIAAISETLPRCIAGMTFSVAILATPITPHFTLRNGFPPFDLATSGRWKSLSFRLRGRHAAIGLPRQNPARIFRLERARLVEFRDLFRRKLKFGRGEVVIKLLNRLGADDDAHHAFALQKPGERDARHRRAVRVGDRSHGVDDVVGALLVDRREIKHRAARIIVAALLTRVFSREEPAGKRAPNHHAEALILDHWHDLALEFAPRDRIIGLD